jgi:hypothetical protein
VRIGFVGLMIWGSVVTVLGLFTLVVAIPWSTSSKRSWHDTTAKTEFHTVRASYWCIVCGLILFLVAGLGATIVRAIFQVKGW